MKPGSALPVATLLLAALLAAGTGSSMIGETTILSSAEDIRQEIDRRQADIDRIDENLASLEARLKDVQGALSTAGEDHAAMLKKVRKLVIAQDQMARGTIGLLLSRDSFQDALVAMHAYGLMMDGAIAEFNQAKQKKAALEAEASSVTKDIETQREIKSLLEKRQKELESQLHATPQTKMYI
jgi:septal ring factor EnvC (AmiA/AmiB activator)